MALAETTKEAVWLKRLAKSLGNELKFMVINEDNQGCISLSKNPEYHQRTKHIDTRYHYIREVIKTGEVKLEYTKTQDQVADVFTKALSKPRFEELRSKLGVKPYLA